METDHTPVGDVHVLACAECPRVSSFTARGWKAFRVENPETGERPELAFYCPVCAEEISES